MDFFTSPSHTPPLPLILPPQDPTPTETIPLVDLNVVMTEQTGHPNGMQITASIKGKSRNIYVYAEQGQVFLFVCLSVVEYLWYVYCLFELCQYVVMSAVVFLSFSSSSFYSGYNMLVLCNQSCSSKAIAKAKTR